MKRYVIISHTASLNLSQTITLVKLSQDILTKSKGLYLTC